MRLTVNIDVDDLDRAVAFYTAGLGLKLAGYRFDGTVAELHGASARIHLLAKPAGSPAVASTALRRDYRRHWTPVHLDFEVDDIAATVQAALAAGATLEGGGIESFAWGRLALMSDPFGHGYCVLQLPPPEQDGSG